MSSNSRTKFVGSLDKMHTNMKKELKESTLAKKTPLSRVREPAKPFKSADTIQESSSDSDSSSDSGSDSDGDLNAARAKLLEKQKAKNKGANAKVNGAAKPVTTPAKAAKAAPKRSPPASAQKSAADSDSDSETESESDSETSSAGTPALTPVAIRTKAQVTASQSDSDSSSDESSSSGNSSEDEAAPAKKRSVNGKALVVKKSDERDSSSDEDEEMASPSALAKMAAISGHESSAEESDSGSESDDEGDGGKVNGTVAVADSTSQLSRASWLNNSEFTLRKASSDNPGKELADFFSSANLEGKQVWYFTAPASLPITVLKDMEIDLTKAVKGGPLLTHGGDNYGLDLESHATNTQIQLLIPSRGGEKYSTLNHAIDSTVHLRRMAKFGPGGEVQSTATDDYVPVPKPIRAQPEGLKARYTPIGVPTPPVPSAITAISKAPASKSSSQTSTKARAASPSSSESESGSDSDVDMTTPSAPVIPASQAKPAKAAAVNGDRKRKHSGDEGQEAKRLKSMQPTKESTSMKRTPIQPPNQTATAGATPSKQSSQEKEAKAKKEKITKSKTPKPAAMSTGAVKQTPIPLPSYPGMRH
ncbi:DNA-directed RNA polymerase I subunit RPA34.5-domain-containing protein [Xylaria sp. CBS 124048]|nr:DNA-directed RNA polymerase I subunit RPA34.5-domain-containing protein [Xylaria sp. CBS 124048]